MYFFFDSESKYPSIRTVRIKDPTALHILLHHRLQLATSQKEHLRQQNQVCIGKYKNQVDRYNQRQNRNRSISIRRIR